MASLTCANSDTAVDPPKQQLTLFVTFHVDPARVDEWKAAHRPTWAALAGEPRCVLFDVFEDTMRPGTMRLVEVWGHGATREWFETVQFKKKYYEELWARSRPTWVAEPEVEYFERVSSDGSAAGTGPGPGIYRRGYLDGAKEVGDE